MTRASTPLPHLSKKERGCLDKPGHDSGETPYYPRAPDFAPAHFIG
jgi:hypothetical protein